MILPNTDRPWHWHFPSFFEWHPGTCMVGSSIDDIMWAPGISLVDSRGRRRGQGGKGR